MRIEAIERDPALEAWDGKVLRGKDGWLFLAHDTNEVLRQQTGELRFSTRQLEDWRLLLETRAAWCQQHGACYLFLVPPNAHSVYPEMLPDDVVSSDERPVLQLLHHLERSRSDAELIYPLDELLDEKRRLPVYARTETHWSELGAFIGYDALMERIERKLDVRRLARSDVELTEELLAGDLGYKVAPVERSPQLRASVVGRQARVVSDNCVENNGALVEFECPQAPPTSCVLFGDSFSLRTLPFVAESFRRLVFAHHATLDFELVREVAPDVVVSVLNERFIWRIPFDLPAPRVRDVARERTLAGRLRAPVTDAARLAATSDGSRQASRTSDTTS